MPLKRKKIVTAAIVLAILAALLVWPDRQPESRIRATDAPKPVEPISGAGKQPASTSPTLPTSPAAPSALLRLGLDELTVRADRGDRKAACLLGFKLLRCARVHMIANDARLMGGTIPPDLEDANRRHLLEARPRARTFVASCQGAPADSKALGFRYVRQAALAGEPEAMYRYARGDVTMMEAWDPKSPEFAVWVKEADAMLLDAFHNGYTPAVMTLWEAYVDDNSPLSQLIPDDRLKAQALEFLMMRLRGEPVDTNAQQLRYPDVALPAAVQAAEWQRKYFSQASVAGSEEQPLPFASLGDALADEGSQKRWQSVATCSH
jgi:hypothetical protein